MNVTHAAPVAPVDHRKLYRLPWSFSDNVIAWLEPTMKCNLACEGCYRSNVDAHKSLDEVRDDLLTFARQRTFDSVSIAGGDPLLHPQIVDIVRMVKEMGWKPVINTNGLAMDLGLMRDLRRAGLIGLTFHIDSRQGRPGWRHKNERDLCALRLQYAEMAATVGGLSCAFNSTVYQDTLAEVPDLVQWAADHIDIVQTMVFIAYREAVLSDFDYYDGAKKVDADRLKYVATEETQRTDITSREIVSKIRERFPAFEPAAYLGGTEKPDSLKWLMAGRYGSRGEVMGYIGPRMMESLQAANHLIHGRYFAYSSREALRMGRTTMAAMSPIDSGSRGALNHWLRWVAKKPLRALERQHYQSIVCIQPIDILPDGRQNMCDACPDITVHNGELVWSCRLEERLNFGTMVRTVPKKGGCAGASAGCGAAGKGSCSPAGAEAC